ncbi:MAG: site-specific integrase, partial [Burkholderiales bacterium]|nr:site-specific integrase [Burkholderiales bacterium]
MQNPSPIDFSKAVRLFLTNYLPNKRMLSHNTVLSYRDSLKLLLKFISEEKGMVLEKFTFKDFTKDLIKEFLDHYKKSGASPSAVNQRLGGIKSFVGFVSTISDENLPDLKAIQKIRIAKTKAKPLKFLTSEQIAEIIDAPDARRRTGLRHKTILALLYDTACRAQELCDLTVGDISINSENPTVKIHGQGGKTRIVPISESTAKTLKNYSDRFLKRAIKTDPLLVNRQGGKLNRDGITYIVQKYASKLAEENPKFPTNVHCHMFRHSKAMHMLQSGVDLPTIRDFLGHENIATTM